MRTASPAEGNQGRGTHGKKITHHELSVRKRSRWVLVFKAPLARREQRDRRIPFGTDEGKAGGRWPPLREGPICVDCFPEHRRGAQWAPVLPYTLRRLIWLSLCFGRRPVAALRGGPICAFFPEHRKGAPNGRPFCLCAPPFDMAFPSAFGGRRWPPYAGNLCGLLSGAP